jgi:integrase
MTPSHHARSERARERRRRRPPEDVYDVKAYRRAIARACERAGVPSWHPHQLRHNAATRYRRERGIEVARVLLGHRSAVTTAIYAEADRVAASKVMLEVG